MAAETQSPISLKRYWIGTLLVGTALAGFWVALWALAVFKPRYRRIKPMFSEYARDVFLSVLRRERISVAR